jgi:hypothetical protein
MNKILEIVHKKQKAQNELSWFDTKGNSVQIDSERHTVTQTRDIHVPRNNRLTPKEHLLDIMSRSEHPKDVDAFFIRDLTRKTNTHNGEMYKAEITYYPLVQLKEDSVL